MNRKQAQKRQRRQQQQQQGQRSGTTYLAEGKNGFLARVPAEKLSAFQAAQKQPDRPLNRAELQLADKIVREIYG